MSEQDRIDAQALNWLERLNGGDMPDQDIEAYVTWMEANPAHAETYRRFEAAWIASAEAADAIRARFGPEARQAGDGGSLLTALGNVLRPFVRPSLTPQFAGAVTATIAVIILALQPQEPAPSSDGVVYATAVGEWRDVALADGSSVTLNTGTELSVHLSNQTRRVDLLSGEAFFSVARDESRPFIVQAGKGQVSVLGTQFNVRLTSSGFSVAVAEGLVAVSPTLGDGQESQQLLEAEQGAEVNTEVAAVTLFAVDTDRLASWRQGRLVYRDTPLTEVIADLSRYGQTEVLVSGEDVGAIAFTGVLNIDTPEVMAQRLAGLLELNVTIDQDVTWRVKEGALCRIIIWAC
jgi:transmembrane sensor